MNVFVASWFFPPATSSEGIVTYKLLRNSKHMYDVVSSTSKQWGYKAAMRQQSDPNITCFPIETDDIAEWVEFAIKKFEELYKKRHYHCIMTRSTPPESIQVGLEIKARHPEIKWIASLADPVANNPYEIKAYIDDSKTLNEAEKALFRSALLDTDDERLEDWEKRPEEEVKLLCKLKRWENAVIHNADMIVSPSSRQLRYLQGNRGWLPKCLAVPHSYDKSFYKRYQKEKGDKTVLSFIGYSDAIRSLEPFVRAVRLLKENNSPVLDKLDMRFIGNTPRFIRDMVINYYLEDVIHFHQGVDYYRSLELMQESDWLLHVDAFFPQLKPGGSIFFAGKLADYMGAHHPILALTGEGSPADNIVRLSGGISLLPWDIPGIANKIEEILTGKASEKINIPYIEQYSATVVAEMFDTHISALCGEEWKFRRDEWPAVQTSVDDKLVTICVPGYNVERYLDRCLHTLIDCRLAGRIEILVIDDGSKDHTADIARTYEKHYPGIVRLIQKKNGGHGSTINRAVKEGKGRYFMVVDGDDWIDSNQFDKLLSDIDQGKVNTDIISSNYHEIDMESGVCTPWTQTAKVAYFRTLKFDELDTEKVYFTLASSLIRLEILQKVTKPLQEHTFYVDVEYILFPVPYLITVTFVDYFIYKYCRGNAEQSVYIPTMIKRYDHHERVMTSVLQYQKDTPMDDAQKSYFNAILKRLLYTHYSLFMVYNQDKKAGYEQGKCFDNMLRQTNPELAAWIGREIPMVRVARHHAFNYERTVHSIGAAKVKMVERWKARFKGCMKHSAFIQHLVYNSITVSIGKMDFFENGKGHALKERLRRFCGFQ